VVVDSTATPALSTLGLTSATIGGALLQCFSGTGTTKTAAPYTSFTYINATPIATLTVTLTSSTSNAYCTVNSNGGGATGATGAEGPQGAAGAQGPQGVVGPGGGSMQVYLGTQLIGTEASLVFNPGGGILMSVSDVPGVAIQVQPSLDTSYLTMNLTASMLYSASASNSTTAYTACPANSGAFPLTKGMIFEWVPDVNGAGGATTLDLCTLGTTSLMLANGTSNPSSASIVAGEMYTIWYDGTVFRMKDIRS
jgi:predicted enzyme related to lactoylglutathione lyase